MEQRDRTETVNQDIDGYDIIGDIHGCHTLLEQLLHKLGYRHDGHSFCHPGRKVIFLGDVIDRGPGIVPALKLVHDMVTHGQAHLLLGNHEYNAIAYFTLRDDGSGNFLHKHTPRHKRNLRATLDQFAAQSTHSLSFFVEWFKSLPFIFEGEVNGQSFHCVHACWHTDAVKLIRSRGVNTVRDPSFWQATIDKSTWQKKVLDCCTRGLHLTLPADQVMQGNDGSFHHEIRLKYWGPQGPTLGDVALATKPLDSSLARTPLSPEQRHLLYTYPKEAPPLFFGHYWLKGVPQLQAPNMICLDYSAVRLGQLVAYRYNGEAELSLENVVTVSGQWP